MSQMIMDASNILQKRSDASGYGFIWTRLAFYVLLYLLCLLTYHGMSDNYLFNDDFTWLREARYEMQPGNLVTHRVINFFRPLVNLSFYSMERISPGNIPLHYSFNLVLHFLNTLLVYHLVSALLSNRKIAAATSVLFALSSVHTGAVFWISARTTLLSTFFLLASITVLMSGGGKRLRVAASIVLYIIALAAKETAIAGFLLILLLFILAKKRGERGSPGIVASYAAISIIYLVTRKAVMGGFIQANWGPGAHMLRNTAGGFLYQLYPWPILTVFLFRATRIPEPTHPFIPEIVAIPLIILLLWAGRNVKKSQAFNLAVWWSVLSLLPASLFRYRFFSTVSITQNRYYYLSSVGSVLIIVLLLSILWNSRSKLRKSACIAIFLLLCHGYIVRVDQLEKKWDNFTMMYREVVEAIIEKSEHFPGFSTLAIEDPPLAFPYIGHALALERPHWKVVEVEGGREKAAEWKPCLYIWYSGVKPKIMTMEKLE